jgi:hypothetical protein
MQLFAAICWLLRCCCLGLCTTGTGCSMSDRVNTQTSMHAYTIACCATQIGQLRLSAGCSEYCRMRLYRVCATWQHNGNTGCKACLTASTHAEQACIYIECSAALTVQLRLFAIYSGYCRMHRVCAACLETRYSLQGPIPTQHFQIGAVMSASMLGSLSCSYAGVCC